MQMNASHKKAIDSYYAALADLRSKGGVNELHLRPAFHNLLVWACKKPGWTLVPEQALPGGRVPDGTLRDQFLLPRGYWEAKDTADDLDVEMAKKIEVGYPLTNIIFEDTHRAVLYQDGQRKLEADLTQAQQVADLLHEFTTHAEPDIEKFEQAVAEFKARIPELAQGVLEIIAKEREGNKRFVAAFSTFHELCKTALDPRISEAQIDEMLVQHLLTERLFRTVFDNQDFTRRNVIASEIERVIDALTSRAFNRAEFLKTLDRFYVAIEDTARGLEEFSEKQHFLNVVYERFFQGFSVKQADTMGIVYTPQEIVDFMCASAEEVLQREFGKSLSTPGVKILDPCVGTGNFIVNILRRIDRSKVKQKYTEDLFCNEIMLLPYYIASLNIEHEYFQLTGEYEQFEGICFTDTLELAEGKQTTIVFSEENTERVQREKHAEITVIIGNPPYNVGQQNENDNNKNRAYPVIDKRIRDTYVKASTATLKSKSYDAYLRFFRWATDRLQGRDGIVGFISNNSFVHKNSLDGMRKHLLQDFTQIYHLDLHGDVRQNPKLSGTTHNVFGIQLGVGITIAVRHSEHPERAIQYLRVPETWTRYDKCGFLAKQANATAIKWNLLVPDEKENWITEGLKVDFEAFLPIVANSIHGKAGGQDAVFSEPSLGVSTNRDKTVYGHSKQAVAARVREFVDRYNTDVDRWGRSDKKDIDSFVDYDSIKWSAHLKNELKRGRRAAFAVELLRPSIYRPFCKLWLYYDPILIDRPSSFRQVFPESGAHENRAISVSYFSSDKPFHCLITDVVSDLHLTGDSQCFPFYTYTEDGTDRRENITDWALAQFREKYGDKVSKWAIFYYIYALLHHPFYRERYAENLKRELPRIPMTVAAEDFPTYADIGRKLADLFLGDFYPLTPWTLDNKEWIGFQFDKPEAERGFVQVFRRPENPQDSMHVKLQGLDPGCTYHLRDLSSDWKADYTGQKLMDEGLLVTLRERPQDALIVYGKRGK